MNKFELYCIIFYALDADWDETKDPQLREFLSRANPFLFTDIGSADPSAYSHFCEMITTQITIENSYKLASEYISTLKNDAVNKAFESIDEDVWIEGVKEYLSSEHKGSELE